MPWHHQHPQRSADPRFHGEHRLRVVARGANGQPRTYRLATSSTQDTAFRRLAVAILGLDVATCGPATLGAQLRPRANHIPVDRHLRSPSDAVLRDGIRIEGPPDARIVDPQSVSASTKE